MPRGTARVRPPVGLLSQNPSQIDLSGFDLDTAFVYLGLATADPKAPVEIRTLGWNLWLKQLIAVSAAFYLVDPLRQREGGLDDVWYSGSHPMYSWPGKLWEGATNWIPTNAPWWFGKIDE